MSEIIFKIIFLVLWVLYILIRAPFDKQYKQEEKIKTFHLSKERSLLVLLSLGLLLIPLIWVFTPILDNFNIELPVWVRLSGVVLSILSLFYFRWIHKTLGANWSPTLEIRKGHQLIKVGAYKKIRHPMYAQIWLWTIAQTLIVSNVVAGFSGLIAWGILYFIRVPNEEKMMVENFGDEYIEYMTQTGRIFPKR
jgi:protein-S-isoprenylcysteine O-methyltransferase Ste14